MDDWYPFADGSSLGQTGTDGGVIERDEAHGAGARITLERGGFAAFSITCGVYGWMVHTRFFSTRDEAEAAYDAMKPELAAIAEGVPMEDDPELDEKRDRVVAMITDFVDRYP